MRATNHLVIRANALVFGVLIAILLMIGGLTWDRFNAAYNAREWSDRSYQVLRVLKDLRVAIVEAESGQRGFVVTGNDNYLTPYHEAIGQIGYLETELQRLTVDNPTQQDRLRALSPPLQRKMDELAQTVELRRTIGQEAATKAVSGDVGRAAMRDIKASLTAMLDDERRLLSQRLAESDTRTQWLGWLILGGTLLTMFILLLAARMLNEAWAQTSTVETRQRDLAMQLTTSLNSLSQGVGVFDADKNLVHWNGCFQTLLDVPKALVRPATPYAAFAEHTAEGSEPLLESVSQIEQTTHRQGHAVVFERRRKDGRVLELRRTGTPDGGFVLTVTDMTKRAEAEGVLREAQKMQAIGQLTGGIAHDFNNLLQVILGNLEFAKAKITGNDVLQTRIERATSAAQRGASLTNQLLAFARRQPLTPTAIDLSESLPTLVPLLERTLGAHIEVRYHAEPNLWPAMADPAQTESAVLNLALNARDAMPGGGRLTIEISNAVIDAATAAKHAEMLPGDYVLLAVSDTGHGMTPEILAHVFEPFFTTKPEGKGTGLGLAMVFGFVKQSGGHIIIASTPGQGTTLSLYLPRAVNVAVDAVEEPSSLALPRGTATVLVVEDDAAVREIAVTILGDLGYKVLQANDGEAALKIFGGNVPNIDLLLTDVVLPGKIRGRDLAERFLAMRPSMPVIFMSGYSDPGTGPNGKSEPAGHLLLKPFRREHLARKVADVLAKIPSAESGTVVPLRSRSV